MQWSPQQSAALKAIELWVKDAKGPQIMRVFGFAGTGKTTMAKTIAESVKGQVLFMTFTGKAALVLKKKGCENTSTIHSAIYKPIEDKVTGHTEFKLNKDSAVGFASLVVVDEVSMVGEAVGRDVLSFGTKVLVLGDPFQLPPISGEGFFTAQKPNIMLTEIHRQAEDNPIIRMSMDIRNGIGLKPGKYGDSLVVQRESLSKEAMRELVADADQLLCGKNATRQLFNRRVREIRGLAGDPEPWMPVLGDKLICLKNNGPKGLLNGGLWEVNKLNNIDARRKFNMVVTSLDAPDTAAVEVQVPYDFFLGAEKDMDWRQRKLADEFCHAYAITVHKSQGSQFDNVLVYDESRIFRDTAANHIYTAVTRAAERVTVVI